MLHSWLTCILLTNNEKLCPGQVLCKRVVWNESRHVDLVRACETYEGVDFFRPQILNGNVLLYEVLIDEKLLGVFLVAVDTLMNGKRELVVLNGKSFNNEFGFIALGTHFVKVIAKSAGIPSIRHHSSSPGAGRIFQKTGWDKLETVWRIRV